MYVQMIDLQKKEIRKKREILSNFVANWTGNSFIL